MSWPAFNRLWMDICNILNSPSYDVLLTAHCSHEPEYLAKPAELTREILASGVFEPRTQGRWRHGRHEPERDDDAIAQFIARLTAHAANGIMEQVKAWDDPWNIQADKVGAWLMKEEATVWDRYEFFSRGLQNRHRMGLRV